MVCTKKLIPIKWPKSTMVMRQRIRIVILQAFQLRSAKQCTLVGQSLMRTLVAQSLTGWSCPTSKQEIKHWTQAIGSARSQQHVMYLTVHALRITSAGIVSSDTSISVTSMWRTHLCLRGVTDLTRSSTCTLYLDGIRVIQLNRMEKWILLVFWLAP